MKKKEQPKYYVFRKDFNTGQMETFDILRYVFDEILTDKGSIIKRKFIAWDNDDCPVNLVPVTSKELLKRYLRGAFLCQFWSRCEYEFIACDWPYKDDGLIENARPVKADLFELQIKPNIDIITDIVWDYIEPKIKK